MKNISITAKALLAFATLALGVMIMSAVSINSAMQLQESVDETGETFKMVAEASKLVGEVHEQNKYIKAFLLTGDRSNLEALGASNASAEDYFKHLGEALGRQNASLQERLQTAQSKWMEWRTGFVQRQLDLMRKLETVDLARAYEMTGEGTELVNSVLGPLDEIANELGNIAAVNAANQHSALTSMEIVLLAGTVIVLALAVLMAFLNHVLISGPLKALTAATATLSSGNTQVTIDQTDRGDEIGRLAESLLIFRDNLIRTRELEAEQKQQEIRTAEERRQAMNDLADQFEKRVGIIAERLSQEAQQLQVQADALSSTTHDIMDQTHGISASSEQASHNVQTVAAAAEELSASISEVAAQITNTSRLALDSQKEANSASEMIGRLAGVVERVSSVTDLIENIARGTNLLALNATVEAARAGEAGKGFAVVASEVKQLAEQTAKATEEINQQIQEMNNVSSGAIQAVNVINEMVREMTENTSAVAAAAEEQGTATKEIAHNVHEAARGTEQVKSSMSSMAKATEKSGDASRLVAEASRTLTGQASSLKQEMDQFISGVRAA
ncbi:MAG: methyl-accepting chemotaxis protein [Rhodomicrobiaceae bacterium]